MLSITMLNTAYKLVTLRSVMAYEIPLNWEIVQCKLKATKAYNMQY